MKGSWELTEPPADIAAHYRRSGWWTDESFGTMLWRGLSQHPDLAVQVWSRARPARLDFDDVRHQAAALAGGLTAHGIGPGDVVAFQLPNWAESVISFCGLATLGVVLLPIVHTYGRKEVGQILAQSGARVLVTADRFGARDYLADLEQLRPRLPDLELVVVVGDGALPTGMVRFTDLLDGPSVGEPFAADPASPAVVAYTSGTGAEPKGVILTHRGMCCEVREHMSNLLVRQKPLLMGSPVSHVAGMLAGVLLPVERGDPVHLVDTWEPGFVLEAMLEGDLASGSGATVFLTTLLDHPDFTEEHRAKIAAVGLGGAPVPTEVAERAENLGISVLRSYGCTEHPTITASRLDQPRSKRMTTEGTACAGVELRIVDDDGRDVVPGEQGEILTRGPDRSGGYTDPALTEEAVDAQWWFATGDIGRLDDEGYLQITDRRKDLIIRGGANISPAEVEQLLAGMAGIAEVAVVGTPDERLGERGCAVLRLRAGATAPTLDDLRRHLDAAGLGKQKWPERVVVVDDFPRTPSGKIKKYVLRTELARSPETA